MLAGQEKTTDSGKNDAVTQVVNSAIFLLAALLPIAICQKTTNFNLGRFFTQHYFAGLTRCFDILAVSYRLIIILI